MAQSFPRWNHRVLDVFGRANESPIAAPWSSLVGEAVQSALASNALTGASDDFYQARYDNLILRPPCEIIARYRAFAFVGTGGIFDTGAGTLVTRTGYTWAINDAGGGLMDAALRNEVGDGSSSTLASNAVSPLPTSGDQIGCEVLENGDIGVYVEYTPGAWTRILTATDSPLDWTSGKLAFGGFGVGTQIDRVTVGLPTIGQPDRMDRAPFPKSVLRRPIGA